MNRNCARNASFLVRALAGAMGLLAAAVLPVRAASPAFISYHGRLLDSTGYPITQPSQLRLRLLVGGTDGENPSTGTLVYHELAVVTPNADGVVTHAIGLGFPQDGCAEFPCTLTSADFPDGAIPLWMEVTVDEDGTAGSADDLVQLPRIRVGTAGYAMRAETLDGRPASDFLDTSSLPQRKAGSLQVDGDLSSGPVTVTGGVQATGPVVTNAGASQATWQAALSGGGKTYTGPPASAHLAGTDVPQTWTAPQTFTRGTSLLTDATMAATKGFVWEHTNPFATTTRFLMQEANFHGVIDHIFRWCLNCDEAGGIADRAWPSNGWAWEMSYDPTDDGTINYVMEGNWDITTGSSHPLGISSFRPVGWVVFPFENSPFATFYFNVRKDSYTLQLNRNGNVGIKNPSPLYDLDIGGYDGDRDGTEDAAGTMRLRGPAGRMGRIELGRSDAAPGLIVTAARQSAYHSYTIPDLTLQAVGSPNSKVNGPLAWASGQVTCASSCTNIGAQGCKTAYAPTGRPLRDGCTDQRDMVKFCLCR